MFDDPVTGFDSGDVVLSGTAGANASTVSPIAPNDGTTYDVAVSGMTQSGTVVASILPNAADNALGASSNSSTSTDNSVTYDVIQPTVTIDQASTQADPTGTSPVHFTVVFSEPVADFAPGDVSLSGTATFGTVTVSGGPTTYDVAVAASGVGTVVATIGASVAHDAAGNDNTSSVSTDNSILFDGVRPSVTIDQASGQADPTNATPVTFSVVFNEPVSGFDASDVSLSGSAGISSTNVSGGPSAYSVEVALSSSGTVVATIDEGAAQDAVGNTSTASSSTDNEVTYDNIAPTVTADQDPGQADPTMASGIQFLVTFDEPVSDFTDSDVQISGTAGATTAAVSGGPDVYSVTVTGMTTSGTVIVDVAANAAFDAAGNASAAATHTDNTVYYDNVRPDVTIDQASGQDDPTNASPIHFTVVFTEPVADFTTGDVSLSGTAGPTTVAMSGGPTTYDVEVSGMTGPGTVIATILENQAHDEAGNPSTASTSTDNTVDFDDVGPTVTVDQTSTQPDPTNASPIHFTVVVSEPVNDLGIDDLDFNTSTGITSVQIAGGPTTYEIAVGVNVEGLYSLSIHANAVHDAAGNGNSASTSTDNAITYDVSRPSVTVNQASGQPDPTSANPMHFTVEFSDPVNDFNETGLQFSGTAQIGGVVVTGGPTTYDVEVTVTTTGFVTAYVPENVAHDAAGNGNTVGTSSDNTITYDPDVPSVTVNQASGQADPTNDSAIAFTVEFSEVVSGFDGSGGDLTFGGTASVNGWSVSGGPKTYNLTVYLSGPGTITVDVTPGAAQDGAGNPSAASTSTDNQVTYDSGRPTVTVEQASGQPDPAAHSPVRFTVTFSEPVNGFVPDDDVTFTGTATVTAAGVSGGPTQYEVTAFLSTDGTVIATVSADRARDDAGNGNTASTSNDNEVTYDGTRPTVTINQASTQSDPTGTSPIHFTAVFSETVVGFEDGDVQLSGTAGATTAVVTGGPSTYDVAVSGMTTAGTVIASIPENVAFDGVAHINEASTSTDNTVTFSTAPANLCGNPGFESNLTGWTRYPNSSVVTLSRVLGSTVGGAHGGSYVLQIRSSDDETFGCDDQPDWVRPPITSANTRYRVTAWVKSTTNTSKAKLRVVELSSSSSQIGSTIYSNEVSLSTTWKLLTAFITVQRSTSSISVRCTESPSGTNNSFLVDDVAIEVVPTFTLVSSAGTGGTISPLGTRTVDSGANQTYTIAANPGYHIDDVKVDGTTSLGPVATYTFTNVTANHTIAATFAANPPGTNLVGNPGFESGLTGWAKYGSGVTLTRVVGTGSHPAHGGSAMALVTSTSSSSFGIDDSPNWVTRVAGAGARYKITAWVKSLNNTGKVKIRVNELEPDDDQVGSTAYSNEPSLSSSWQLLTAFITVRRGSSKLSVRITEAPPSSNRGFYIDDISIELVPGAVAGPAASGAAEAGAALQFGAFVTPNPARHDAVLRLTTTRPGPLRVRMFDIAGRVQHVLVDEVQAAAGERTVALRSGRGRIEPGVYFYRVEAGEGMLKGRVVILE